MNRYQIPLAVAVVALCLCVPSFAAEPQLAHMVFFSLKDNSDDAVAKIVAGCKEYLSDHDGTVYFSVGARAKEMDRDVNDTDFDVALHLVFRDKAAHDKYAEHPRHLEFIEKFKENWAKVRVFDSCVEPTAKK